jgi:hypothetical protein
MPRLPVSGKDEGLWGDLLNSYLLTSHTQSGALKNNIISAATIQNGAITQDKLAAGSVTTSAIAQNAVTSTALAPGAVNAASIAQGAVSSSAVNDNSLSGLKIIDASITESKLSADLQARIAAAPSGSTIADGSVTEAKLADNSVTSIKIKNGTIAEVDLHPDVVAKLNTVGSGAPTIADGSITSAKIADGTIASTDLADAAVTPAKLFTGATADTPANGEILSYNSTESKFEWVAAPTPTIADGSITSAKIADGTIATTDLADAAVTTIKLNDAAVTPAKLFTGATADTPANGEILSYNSTESKFEWVAAPTPTIADGSITSAKIADGTIASTDLADAAVTPAKLFTGATADTPANGEILSYNSTESKFEWVAAPTPTIADGSITSAKIADGAIATTDLADAAVTPAKLFTGATADTPANGEILSYNSTESKFEWVAAPTPTIADGSITSAKIADGTIATTDLADAAVTTIKLNDAAVTPAKLFTGATADTPANGEILSYNSTESKFEWVAAPTPTIADGSITSAKIADGTIASTDLADAAVTPAKLFTGATADTPANGEILSYNSTESKFEWVAAPTPTIADGSITSAKIADGTIASTDLADAAVTPAKLFTGATADTPANGEILSYNSTESKFEWVAAPTPTIADGSITSAKIADGTIATTDLADAAVTTIKLNDAAVTPAKLFTGATADTPANGEILSYNSTESKFEWVAAPTVISPIANQYTAAQVSASFWIDGKARADDQIIVGGKTNQAQLIVKSSSSQTAANAHISLRSNADVELARVYTDATNNVGIGRTTLSNVTGSGNTGLGNNALGLVAAGAQNTAVGYNSQSAVTTGNNNASFGADSLRLNTSGVSNTSIGFKSLENTTTGQGNTALGVQAGQANTTGQGNTYVGVSSGNVDINGAFVTTSGLQNANAIGAYAQVQSNNSVVLGSVDLSTKVGLGTTIPLSPLSVSPVQYSTGTASQSGTAVTGTGTTWTSAMVGMQFIFANGLTGLIQSVTDATHLVLSTTQTVVAQAYRIHSLGLQVASTGYTGIGTQLPTKQLHVVGDIQNDGMVITNGVNARGIEAANPTNVYHGQWTMLGSCTITIRYDDCRFIGMVISTNDSSGQDRATVDLRVKQQNALGGAPVVSLNVYDNAGLLSDDFAAVVTTNTVAQTVVQLWGKVRTQFQVWRVVTIANVGTVLFSLTQAQPFQAALPAGTQTVGANSYTIAAGTMMFSRDPALRPTDRTDILVVFYTATQPTAMLTGDQWVQTI